MDVTGRERGDVRLKLPPDIHLEGHVKCSGNRFARVERPSGGGSTFAAQRLPFPFL